jgi:hypothetical protein
LNERALREGSSHILEPPIEEATNFGASPIAGAGLKARLRNNGGACDRLNARALVLLFTLLSVVVPSLAAAADLRAMRPTILSSQLPLYFEANDGQADPAVKFIAVARGRCCS